MPIYEYQCQKCHHHLEALQKIADKPLRECPECGKHSLKRLVSAPRFRLAGSGWYETDFKSDGERKRNLAGKDEAPAAAESAKDSGADKAVEPKPAAAAPAGAKKSPQTAVTRSAPSTKGRPKASTAKAPKKPSRPAARKGSRKR